MPERDFWDITPRAFFNKMKGYNQVREREFQDGWERARWMVTVLANYSGKVAKKTLRPSDLMEFEWDKKKSKSKDEIKIGKKRFEQLKDKWHE